MKVHSKPWLETLGFFLVLSIYPITSLIRGDSGWIWAIVFWTVVTVVAWFYYRSRLQQKIRYESDDDKIIVSGSREEIYDPDVIRLDEIAKVERDNKSLVISTRNGGSIRLIRLGRRLADVEADLQRRIGNFDGR